MKRRKLRGVVVFEDRLKCRTQLLLFAAYLLSCKSYVMPDLMDSVWHIEFDILMYVSYYYRQCWCCWLVMMFRVLCRCWLGLVEVEDSFDRVACCCRHV